MGDGVGGGSGWTGGGRWRGDKNEGVEDEGGLEVGGGGGWRGEGWSGVGVEDGGEVEMERGVEDGGVVRDGTGVGVGAVVGPGRALRPPVTREQEWVSVGALPEVYAPLASSPPLAVLGPHGAPARQVDADVGAARGVPGRRPDRDPADAAVVADTDGETVPQAPAGARPRVGAVPEDALTSVGVLGRVVAPAGVPLTAQSGGGA